MTPDGLTACVSSHGPKETMDRLIAAVTSRGMTVLARIDHAARGRLHLRDVEMRDPAA